MGHFANGCVFTSKPEFDAASKVIPGQLARGYKHNHHPVWLLDLWKPRGKLQLLRSPFCDPAVSAFRIDLKDVDTATRSFVTIFERLQKAIGYAGQELSYVHLGLAVAAAAGCPAFVFAADDEEADLACNAVSGSLVSFGCRLDRLSVQYSGSQIAVTPLNHLENNDEEGLHEIIGTVKSVAGVHVLEPRESEGGQVLYENPVGQWPKAAGSPADILGLGTWDPLLNLEKDFVVVFERLSV